MPRYEPVDPRLTNIFMVAEQFDDDYAQHSEYTLSDPDEEEDPMAFLFADGEDDDGEDEGDDAFEDSEDGETAPLVPAEVAGPPSDEAILQHAEQLCRQIHPGHGLADLTNAERSAVLAQACAEMGYQGACSVEMPMPGSDYNATASGLHSNQHRAGVRESALSERYRMDELVRNADVVERRAIRLAKQRALDDGKRWSELTSAEQEKCLDEGAAAAGYRGTQRW